jgi:hypothetical protein
MLAMAGLISGSAWFALATVAFRRSAPSNGVIPHWVQSPEMQALIVFVVLGGWSLGTAFVIQAIVSMLS